MKKTYLASLLVLLIFSGCGFQMRGNWELPPSMNQTGLQGGSHQLYRELKKGFSAAGASISRESQSGPRLRIIEELFDKRTLSIDATGKALEYEIFYVLKFEVLAANGSIMVEPQRLNLVRDFLYVSGDVYGTSRQEKLLRDQMYEEMVDLILRRIQAQAG